jgi:hypothetical protein
MDSDSCCAWSSVAFHIIASALEENMPQCSVLAPRGSGGLTMAFQRASVKSEVVPASFRFPELSQLI